MVLVSVFPVRGFKNLHTATDRAHVLWSLPKLSERHSSSPVLSGLVHSPLPDGNCQFARCQTHIDTSINFGTAGSQMVNDSGSAKH